MFSGKTELFIRNEKSIKEYFKLYPAVSVIILINAIMFLITVIDGGSTNIETLVKYGAFHRQGIEEGEFYRILTPMVLHIGVMHFIMNTFFIAIFTADIEKLFGTTKYLFLYVVTGIGGTVAVYYFSSVEVAAGASGAIYGLLGTLLYMVFSKKYDLNKEAEKMIVVIVGFNIGVTLIVPGISTAAHLGGLAVGFVLSAMMLGKSKVKE